MWLFYYSHAQSLNKTNEGSTEGSPIAKKPRFDENSENKGHSSPSKKSESTHCCKTQQVLKDCGVDKLETSVEELDRLRVDGLAFPSPILWCNDWRRETLCDCDTCRVGIVSKFNLCETSRYKVMLKDHGIEFLLDSEDSIERYMEIGRQKLAEIAEKRDKAVSQALAELPHAAAIEVAHGESSFFRYIITVLLLGINRFKRALTEFITRPRDRNVSSYHATAYEYLGRHRS